MGSARNRVGAAAGAIFSLEKIRLLSGCARLCEERMDAQLASYSKPAAGQRGIQFVIRNKGCWLGHLGEQRIVFPPWKSQFAKRLCNLLRAVIMIAQKRTVMGISGRKLFRLFGERGQELGFCQLTGQPTYSLRETSAVDRLQGREEAVSLLREISVQVHQMLRQLRALMDGTIRQLHHAQKLAGIHQLTYPPGRIPPGNDLRAVHITSRSARRDADAGCIVPCAVGLSVYHQAISAPVVLRKVRCKNVQWQLLHKIHANVQPEFIRVAT